MNGNSKVKDFISTVAYAFLAQGISLLLSILMSLVVPKILGIEEFGYWQLFIFYSSYVGFFHFGLNDGIYLRYGGMDYEELDFKLISSQFWVALILQTIFSIGVSIFSLIFINDFDRQFVFITSAIYLVLFNMSSFIGFIFQAVNRVNVFSTSVIIDKVFFIISVLVLLVFKTDYYKIFVVLFLVSKLVSFVYCIIKGREMIFSKSENFKVGFSEIVINVSKGINLMLSNIASLLILGIGRFIVDRIWGVAAFGKFSFSLSLTNFFLLFISQVSMVLFPTLRRTSGEQQKVFYNVSRNILDILLAGIFLFYVPIAYLLELWLPQYSESIKYLILLLPLCTFDGKMQMLCTTYLKVMNKERTLLKINVLSMVISLVLSLIGGYVFKNINLIIIFMVVAIAIRSVIAEIYLSKLMDTVVIKSIVYEMSLAVIFVASTWFLRPSTSFIIYFVVYSIYLFNKRKDINEIRKNISGLIKG